MKKRVTLGTTVSLILLAIILTFQITYVTVSGKANDRVSTGKDENSFIARAAEKLSEVDSIYRSYYIRDLDDDVLIDYILKGYVAGTGDFHGAYYNAEQYGKFMNSFAGNTVGIGVNVLYDSENGRIEITNVFKNSPAEKAGILVGDFITAVGEDNEKVADIGYNEAVLRIRGEAGTDAHLIVLRGEKEIEFTIKRAEVESESVFFHVCDLDKNVGIIRVTAFNENTSGQFIEAFESLKKEGCGKFVFDLRNNPGGALTSISTVLDYLLPEGPIIRVLDADGNIIDQLDSDEKSEDYPFAVLVSGSTASAAELFTSALHDYNKAVIVGTLTYGKGTIQTTVPTSDGCAVHVTYRMYNPPFSDNYDGIGITPDIIEEPNDSVMYINPFKLADKDDNQLLAALSSLK